MFFPVVKSVNLTSTLFKCWNAIYRSAGSHATAAMTSLKTNPTQEPMLIASSVCYPWPSTTSIKLMGLGWLESYRIWLYALTPTIILTSPKKPWFSRGFTHLSHLGVFNIRGVGLRSKGPKTAEIPYHCDPPQKQSGDWWLSNHENRQNNQILVLPSCRYIDR